MLITVAFGISLLIHLFMKVGMPLLTLGGCVILSVEALGSLIDFRGTYAWLYLIGTVGLITTVISYIFLVRIGYDPTEIMLFPAVLMGISAFILGFSSKVADQSQTDTNNNE
jgi:hypothetical protein